MTKAEHPLPAQQNQGAARKAEGFATPKQDKKPQCARMLPKRVLPIIFLPGIMGSNLRMSEKRQKQMRRKGNIAWRPDSLGPSNIHGASNETPAERQLRLDPLETTVDVYEPSGLPNVSGDERNSNVKFKVDLQSPLLTDDPPTATNRQTAVQKARARGWGEVYFGSYGKLLQHLESRLNNTFFNGQLQAAWRDVVGVDPTVWNSHPGLPLKPLTEDDLKTVATGCWFAVYAFGYNWLQSNGDSAKVIATRINKVIDEMNSSGYQCDQVVVVTHSMGGLVGRALIHPDYGNLQEKILGIVHGVMPAIGAPAAYKRIRAGFEDPGMIGRPSVAVASIGAKVSGNYGDEVTAVLANAPGGLELLPTESYGNGWLRVIHNGRELEVWPKRGDPYNEIYKVKNKWYALFREEWINPSGQPVKEGGGSFRRTCNYLSKVQGFHQKIAHTFHPNSYAHYGADRSQQSFSEVVWEIRNCDDLTDWQNWSIFLDTKQGKLDFTYWDSEGVMNVEAQSLNGAPPGPIYAEILPPSAPGDQTVPTKSADHQLNSGIFKGVFRQTGYDHQSSYQDQRAIASTLYSIVRIAQAASQKC